MMDIERARYIAAQCWCMPETENIEMDTRLAEAFAKTLVDAFETHTPPPGYALVKLEGAEERVARAICEADGVPYDEVPARIKPELRKQSQAAIKAMVEGE